MDLDQTVFVETAQLLARQLQEAAIDYPSFEQALPLCELTKCRATCCHDGVILSDEEAGILSSLGGGEGIKELPDGRKKSKTRAADTDEIAGDFPGHFPKTRCVFLDEQHRCQWQLRAVSEGKPAWFYKPTSCWMHPVLLSSRDGRPLLGLLDRTSDSKKFASYTPCGSTKDGSQPARLSLQAELEMLGDLSGRNFFGELNAPEV